MKRPPSYSDSFLFLPDSINSPLRSASAFFIDASDEQQEQQEPLALQLIKPTEYTPAEKWYNRLIGFGLHITLISMFETIFFFLYVSRTEDSGLRNTVEDYVSGVLTSCGNWTSNTTLLVNDILTLFINASSVYEQSQASSNAITTFNRGLQIQAWMYVLGLFCLTSIGLLVGRCARLRLAWRRILLENLIMVTLLGLYEYTFFSTIIYNYDNMSLPELNEYVVTQLQQTCGLLGGT